MKDPSKALLNRLKKELDAATDPQTVIRVSKLMDKLAARLAKQEPKPVDVKASAPKPKPVRTGSAVDDLPPDKRLVHDIVIRAEEIIRDATRQGLPVPTTDQACDQAHSELTPAS